MTEPGGYARVARANKKLAEEGGCRFEIRLQRTENEALSRLVRESGESRAEVVRRLILEADKALQEGGAK